MSVIPRSTPVAAPRQPVRRVSTKLRIATMLAVIIPFVSLFAAAIGLWGWGFHWTELGLFLGMYLLTGLGITVGFHRLFAHRSFETPAFMQAILAILGSMALQRSPLKWVAVHRYHHQHSDTENDVHSPQNSGDGIRGMLKGLWHAHLGWLFKSDPPGLSRYIRDLRKSRILVRVSRTWYFWVAVGLAIPTVLGAILIGGWTGALLGLIWGGLVRVFFVHHVTWSVNSICHIWGQQPHQCDDNSRNNVVVGVLALGEGWHNNHHAFPTSARHGLKWWQLDLSYIVIRLMGLCGLARNIKVAKPLRG